MHNVHRSTTWFPSKNTLSAFCARLLVCSSSVTQHKGNTNSNALMHKRPIYQIGASCIKQCWTCMHAFTEWRPICNRGLWHASKRSVWHQRGLWFYYGSKLNNFLQISYTIKWITPSDSPWNYASNGMSVPKHPIYQIGGYRTEVSIWLIFSNSL